MADIIDVNIADQTIEVFWQDEVELNLDLNLMYIKSGEQEIKNYVDNVSKPEIDNYIKTEAKPIVSEVVVQIAEPTVNEYLETETKPAIDKYFNDKKPEIEDLVSQAENYASNSQTSAQASAASALAAKVSETNAKASELAAKQSETNAKTSETNAKTSENNAEIWAEGTDAQVQALGGEKSAKGWAEASTNVNYTNITNCITAIPQDIKLELVDGVMTLKAGSKVYKANGESVIISGDLVAAQAGTNSGAFAFYRSDNNTVYTLTAASMFSGATAPESPVATTTWLDTGAKDVKFYDGTQWVGGVSLPLCIFDNQDGKVTAVTQVFNGFGYIGSTAFILPGVKGLAPYGRNKDGSLKNFEIQVHGLCFRSITWDCSKGQELFLGYDSGAMNPCFVSSGNLWRYFEQSTEPSSPEKYDIWYNPDANIIKRYLEDGWKDVRLAYLGQWFTESISPYRVTELKTKPTFQAVDYNDYAADIQKCKLIAYDAGRNPGSLSGSYTLVLQENDERVSLAVADNVTINIDTSQLTFPEEWYTVVFEIYFPNGAKTVNLSYAGGIRWVNGLTPDFTNGLSHLVALTKHRSWGDVAMSDAGSLGG